MDETNITGDVRPGDIITLGWDYYEERNFLLMVTHPFNVRAELEAYWQATRDKIVKLEGCSPQPATKLRLPDGYMHFTLWLAERELARVIKPTVEIRPVGSTGSDPFRDLFVRQERMSNDPDSDEFQKFNPDQKVEALWKDIVR